MHSKNHAWFLDLTMIRVKDNFKVWDLHNRKDGAAFIAKGDNQGRTNLGPEIRSSVLGILSVRSDCQTECDAHSLIGKSRG